MTDGRWASVRSVVIEADGGSRGNPGPAAYGAVLKDAETGEVIAEDGTTIGEATNNVAEYSGLIAGLRMAREAQPLLAAPLEELIELPIEEARARVGLRRETLAAIDPGRRSALIELLVPKDPPDPAAQPA